jgi:hypothetical protein
LKPGIRISVTGFAEFVTTNPASRYLKLRPFKFKNKGEGAGRSSYYKPALTAIRKYHESGNNPVVFEAARKELSNNLRSATKRHEQTNYERNLSAIEAYERIYANRQFRILTNHRLIYRIGSVTITAQPHLWVEEAGKQVLIKIGVAKKQPAFVDVMLYLIRKAAISSGYRIRARNIVYLDITNGKERCCDDNLRRFNRVFLAAAREVAAVWDSLSERVND